MCIGALKKWFLVWGDYLTAPGPMPSFCRFFLEPQTLPVCFYLLMDFFLWLLLLPMYKCLPTSFWAQTTVNSLPYPNPRKEESHKLNHAACLGNWVPWLCLGLSQSQNSLLPMSKGTEGMDNKEISCLTTYSWRVLHSHGKSVSYV